MIFLIENCMICEDDDFEKLKKEERKILFFDNYNDLIKIFERENIYDKKFFIFSSVNIAKKILLNNNQMRKGIIYSPKFFEPSFYSQYIERENFLNKDYILLPFGQLIYFKDKLFHFFNTEKLFIKSNKNDRSSNPFIVEYSNYDHEILKFKQTYKIYDEEIFFITEHKKISEIEKRFWICDGEIIAEGYYSFNNCKNFNYDILRDKNTTEKFVMKSVEKFLDIENWFTVDICISNKDLKIVELNSFSTSGFYEGVNFKNLFSKIEESLYL